MFLNDSGREVPTVGPVGPHLTLERWPRRVLRVRIWILPIGSMLPVAWGGGGGAGLDTGPRHVLHPNLKVYHKTRNI